MREAAAEMPDCHGSGPGVMELNHRGREFMEIATTTEADLREPLPVPASHELRQACASFKVRGTYPTDVH